MSAAFWSAVAAIFSALAAVIVMFIQRRNQLESVRPEIVLVGWGRFSRGHGDAAHEGITIESIKNVGRGAALHLYIHSAHVIDHRPVAVLSTRRLPILAPNDSVALNAEITLWWKNAPSTSSSP